METITKTFANTPTLAERAHNIRRNALRMGEVQGQGYIAQALDISDVLAAAYFHAMRYRPEDPTWEERDRFLLSNGHYAIALYAALIEAGIVPEAELETYGFDESRLPMSGMASYTPGMEMSGGSPGGSICFLRGTKRPYLPRHITQRLAQQRFQRRVVADLQIGHRRLGLGRPPAHRDQRGHDLADQRAVQRRSGPRPGWWGSSRDLASWGPSST